MACCGNKSQTSASASLQHPGAVGGTPPRVRFTYVGATALTVAGPTSGLTYRFPLPGAVLAVDPRDREMLRRVPSLREGGN